MSGKKQKAIRRLAREQTEGKPFRQLGRLGNYGQKVAKSSIPIVNRPDTTRAVIRQLKKMRKENLR